MNPLLGPGFLERLTNVLRNSFIKVIIICLDPLDHLGLNLTLHLLDTITMQDWLPSYTKAKSRSTASALLGFGRPTSAESEQTTVQVYLGHLER